MDWGVILNAVLGHPAEIDFIVRFGGDDYRVALATPLLLDEAPHPTAALAVAAGMLWPQRLQPILAALAPQIDAALAAWRADPHWAERAVGAKAQPLVLWNVVRMVRVQHDGAAALRDAVAVVLHSGDPAAINRCLETLGADGWATLEDDLRAALLARASAAAHGRVWTALDDAQRTAAAQAVETDSFLAARLIGAIGAVAWSTTDPTLRDRVIDVVAQQPSSVSMTAPAWPGMTDGERNRLATSVIAQGGAWDAFRLLDDLGAAGRATLTADLRAALERRAMEHPDAWRVRLMRVADIGWDALPEDERRVMLAAADQEAEKGAVLLCVVGAAGWRAMSADEQSRLAAVVRRMPIDLFRCPPTLWTDLAGDALPSATTMSWIATLSWRVEDADADLGVLPAAHRAVVLALAPWRAEDAAKDSVRAQRLRAAWTALPDDERVALATAQPHVLATVAAAARLAGGASAARAAVGATAARVVTATGGADAKRAVGAMLRTPARWRSWMIAFAPTAGDPPDVWKTWRAAARRGAIPDPALCARLAAKERDAGAPAHAVRRTGR